MVLSPRRAPLSWFLFGLLVGQPSLLHAIPETSPLHAISEGSSLHAIPDEALLRTIPDNGLAPERHPTVGIDVIRVPSHFSTIQAALNASSPGDTILVSPGRYTGEGNRNLDFGGKDVVLLSQFGFFATTIDCEGEGRVFEFTGGETNAAVVEGFFLRGGDATESRMPGGGILLAGSSPTIRSCIVALNTASAGGGIACTDGSFPVLSFCFIAANSAADRGGGVSVDATSAATVSFSSIQDNFAGSQGGGLSVDGGLRRGSSVLWGTNVVRNFTFGDGGGIACSGGASLQVESCLVQGNAATGAGGGVFVDASSAPEFAGTVIAGNHATGNGAGLSAESALSIVACTFADNRSESQGGGLFLDANATLPLENTILWANCDAGGGSEAWVAGGSTLDFSCSLVDSAGLAGAGASQWDANTVFEDPLFFQPACCAQAPIFDVNGFQATYTLAMGSPALDANNPCGQLIGAEGAGDAGPLTGFGLTLLSQVPVSQFECSVHANEMWGYVSPSGREYAIVGLGIGTGFVEVTDPANPVVIDVVPDARSLWSDMATYGEYAYNVNESASAADGVQIIDLTQIDAGTVTLVGNFTDGGFTDAHNIAVNEASGFAYLCLPGILGDIVALDLANPASPVIAGSWEDGTDNGVHDVYVVTYTSGPFAGREIAYAASEGAGLHVVDVTDKADMFTVAIGFYPNLSYCHQAWLSSDHRYLFVNDELDEIVNPNVTTTTTYVFDVQNPADPQYHSSFTTGSTAIDHNLIVRDNLVFQANYTSGLHVFDASNIDDVQEIAYFDTHPESEAPTFDGAWGVYPLLPSGTILVSDFQRGLLVFELSGGLVRSGPPLARGIVELRPNFPNPFTSQTTFQFATPRKGPVRLAVYDVTGRLVRTLVDDVLPEGSHRIEWDGRSERGTRLASGVYLTRLQSDATVLTRKSVILK